MTVHIIGAGIAGLAAALRMLDRQQSVCLYEAAPMPGGRCRSFAVPGFPDLLDCGPHLIAGPAACPAIWHMLRRIRATDRVAPLPLLPPLFDLEQNRPLRLPLLRLGWELLGALLRPANGTGRTDPERRICTVADLFSRSPLYRSFWQPLSLSVCNLPAEDCSWPLLQTVLRRTVGRGLGAMRLYHFTAPLQEAVITPALTAVQQAGGHFFPGQRLTEIRRDGQRATALHFSGGTVRLLGPADRVVLAVPSRVCRGLLPEYFPVAPQSRPSSILNATFQTGQPLPLHIPPMTGLTGGTSQWLFRTAPNQLTVTVSAADSLPRREADQWMTEIWHELRQVFPELPPRADREKLIHFRFATEINSPKAALLDNIVCIGDWTVNELPNTLEAAALSSFYFE